MTNLTKWILQKPILRSQFLSLALIILGLIAFQATPASAQGWTTGGGNTTTTDKVGIGTTAAPEAKLHIVDTSGSAFYIDAYGYVAGIRARKANGTVAGPIRVHPGEALAAFNAIGAFAADDSTNAQFPGLVSGRFRFLAAENFTQWHQGTYWALDTTQIGTTGPVERMRISDNGYVGIGLLPANPNPTEMLDVLGNVKITGNIDVSGNIKAKYQDVAEWVPASAQIPAGTVVVLDATKSNHVISSTRGYDTRVAGVISAQPGITLGESGSGKVLVATTGRVRIKVDATRIPIRVGDLLVTSNVPGLAMKSRPVSLGGVQLHRPGTLIGKALEPLAKGKGEILVLLSLQ